MKKYLVRFAQVREDFRLDELKAICEYVNIEFPEQDVPSYNISTPFWVAHFEDDDAVKKILSRTVLIIYISGFLAYGVDTETAVEETKKIPESFYAPYTEASFRFTVDMYAKKFQQPEQTILINKFSFMPLNGPVVMKDASVIFSLHYDGTTDALYVGRLIGEGRRDLIDRFNLKKRQYLGTTSMDAELSLVMCNMAQVGAGQIMYDPFVGTGSFLCTAASFGALTLGSDIDGRQMRGKGSACLRTNMRQYGVQSRLMDALVFDVLQNPWRNDFCIDAIITDPPYGVRAGAKKIGTKSPYPPSHSAFLTPSEKADRYPKTVPYDMSELAVDLMGMAKKTLRNGGRLVYWYAVDVREDGSRPSKEEFTSMLPHLEGMTFITMLLDRCRHFDRWLLVYKKD